MTTVLASLKPVSQTEKAYEAIKELILRGEVHQGEALSIFQLSEYLKLGRSPISSACQRLEYDGLVRVIPKQGVWINTISIEEAKEIYESRVALECYFHRRAFELYTQDDVDELKRSMERQLALGEKGERYGYMQEDMFFHQYPMGRYQNAILREMHVKLADRIVLLGVRNVANVGRVRNAMDEHARIVSAMEARDLGELLAAVERHIMYAYIERTGVSSVVNK